MTKKTKSIIGTLMNSFLFFDPRRLHSKSELDWHIDYIDDLEKLYKETNTSSKVLQIVCICSSDTSTVINQIQNKSQIVSIYVCGNRNHGVSQTNPSYGSKVFHDILFEPDSDWEFNGRSTLVAACIDHQYDAQFMQENHQLRNITRTSMSTPPLSVTATNP